jgi:phytoene dehydrogenase-like protein
MVIGAGHNGLVCAAYLARAGLRTLLVEARSSVGGTASSESFGGGRVNICNCDHLTFRTTPIIDELGLADHGLRYVDLDPAQRNMTWDGLAWSSFYDVERTVDSLAQTYPTEVDNYRRIPVGRDPRGEDGVRQRQRSAVAHHDRQEGVGTEGQGSRHAAEVEPA